MNQCYVASQASAYAIVQSIADRAQGRITAREELIDADVGKVAEILMDDGLPELMATGKGALQLYTFAVHAMNLWHLIEQVQGGRALTREQRSALPAIYRDLKPYMQDREVLVREIAELSMEREASRMGTYA